MTNFDYIVFTLLLISGLVGFGRGAAREVVAITALIGGAAAALLGFRQATAIADQFISPHWLAVVASVAVLFGGVYIVLRLLGAGLARRVRGANVLGALDRTVGLLIGLVRGLVVLGALQLMFIAATPPDLQPRWITGARTWPLASNMGQLLESLAPRGLDAAGRLKPAFDRAVSEPLRDRSATDVYDARRGGEASDLVEKSR